MKKKAGVQCLFCFIIILLMIISLNACNGTNSQSSSTLSEPGKAAITENMETYNGLGYTLLCPKDWDKSKGPRFLAKLDEYGKSSCSIQIGIGSLVQFDEEKKAVLDEKGNVVCRNLEDDAKAGFKLLGDVFERKLNYKKTTINGNTAYRVDYFFDSKSGRYVTILETAKEGSQNLYGLIAMYSDPQDKNILEVMINSFEIIGK